MKQLEQKTKRASDKAQIIRWLMEEDVDLTPDQLKKLKRIEKADELMRSKVDYQTVIKTIAEECGVTKSTADGDYFDAMAIFGAVRRLDKTYLMWLKYQRQEEDIEALRARIKKNESIADSNEEVYEPDYRLLQTLAKMEEAATYTFNSIPENRTAPPVKQPVFIFNNVGGSSEAPMTVEDAIILADKMIANDNLG